MNMNKKNVSFYTKEQEIKIMTLKIIERYNIIDYKLAKSIAISLYENGIQLDKFTPKYYKGKFDLDEIVMFFLNKNQIKEKIIAFKIPDSYQKDNHTKLDNPKKGEIIPYKQKKITRNKKKDIVLMNPK